MDELRFEVKFDKEVSLFQLRETFKLQFANTKSKLYSNLKIGMGLGFFAVVANYSDDHFIARFFGFFCALLLFTVLLGFYGIRKSERRYMEEAEAQTNLYSSEDVLAYSFSEELMTFRDRLRYYEMDWSLFSSYVINEGHLYMLLGKNGVYAFCIGRNEIGTENWEALIQIVSQKLNQKQ